ncbi:hypothetical protein VKT23_010356 [Stygiomarasmius scandens]|uniref:Membrane-associated protein n=1 Tax=Marasmiellus scandens TaxID=2682957 RepID=A0ABR1JBF6_9AGAR
MSRTVYCRTIFVVLIVFMLISPSLATKSFNQCLQGIRDRTLSLDESYYESGGRTNNGTVVSISNTTSAISYELCVVACGSDQEAFNWSAFSQEFSSWLLPWLALISQLPFGANDKFANFISMLLAVGSPTLAAYSVMLTVLNSRWVARIFHKLKYPNVQSAVRILSSLQQAPVRVDRLDPYLLPSLVVLPENDDWWTELREHLEYTHTWSVSAATSIAWVVIAYIFTIIDSFTADIGQLIEVNGQGVGSVWIWLLAVVFSWLQISPKCDSKRIDQALQRTNDLAYVATSDPLRPVRASSLNNHRAIYLRHGHGSLHADERCTAPIFNYSRVFTWSTTAEEVAECFRQAHGRVEIFEAVRGREEWVAGDRNTRVPKANRMGTAMEIRQYCRYYPEVEPVYRWGSGVWSRIFVASLMALFLQWGTTGAAMAIVLMTPTRGLGCRSAAYLGYACLSTLVWGLLVLSSILSHYSTFTTIDPIEGKPRFNLRSRIAADMSIFFRKLGKVIASVNAIGVVVINMFQFSSFFNRCYCNSSVIGLGMENAYFVIEFHPDDINSTRLAWKGGSVLALGTAAIFVGVLNLLINPSLPEE